jgi:hypothetical protein
MAWRYSPLCHRLQPVDAYLATSSAIAGGPDEAAQLFKGALDDYGRTLGPEPKASVTASSV